MGEQENTTNVNMREEKEGTLAGAAEQSSADLLEMKRLLQEIKKSGDLQVKYAKKQYHMSFLRALACFLMLAAVCVGVVLILPYVGRVLGDLNVIMEDLKVVTGEIAELDIDEMYTGVEDLIVQGSNGLTEAFKKIDEIDIEGLNRAIKNLSDAVQPFAAFFGRGR